MIEVGESQEDREFEYLKIFYPDRKIPKYETIEEDQLLKLAFDLKEKRKTSVEGLLYIVGQETNKNSDDLLSGEGLLVKKEKDKYIQYLIQKHQKWLPSELKKDKLYRKVRRLVTLKPKMDKNEKKEKGKDDKDQENEDLGAMGSPEARSNEELFEDEEDMDQEYDDRFEENEGNERESNDGGGDYD